MSYIYCLALPDARLMFHVKHDAVKQENIFYELGELGKKMFHVKHQEAKCFSLLLAGGRAPSTEWLKDVAGANELKTYCADKGVEYAISASLLPQLVVGDCDSGSQACYEQAKVMGARLELHPSAKDDTDLQLLLQQLPPAPLLASGIWGGRFDHLFSNVYSLLEFKQKHGTHVIMADEQEMMLLLTTDEKVEINLEMPKKVHALSILPLSESAVVSCSGVRWSLLDAELTQRRPYAISNEALAARLLCACHKGYMGLYLHWKN